MKNYSYNRLLGVEIILLMVMIHCENVFSEAETYPDAWWRYTSQVSSIARLDMAAWLKESPIAIVKIQTQAQSGIPNDGGVDPKDTKTNLVIFDYAASCQIIELVCGLVAQKKWEQKWTETYREGDEYFKVKNESWFTYKEHDLYLNSSAKESDERCYAVKVNADKKDSERLTYICKLPEELAKDFSAAFTRLRDAETKTEKQKDEAPSTEPNLFIATHIFGQLLKNGEYERCIAEMILTKDIFRQTIFAYMCSSDHVPKLNSIGKYDSVEARLAQKNGIKKLMEFLEMALKKIPQSEYKSIEGIALGIFSSSRSNSRSNFCSIYSVEASVRIYELYKAAGFPKVSVPGLDQEFKHYEPENPDVKTARNLLLRLNKMDSSRSLPKVENEKKP